MLAYYYSESGNYAGAEELLITAQEIYDEAALEEHLYMVQLLRTRGALKQATGSYAEALSYYEDALAMAERMYGPDHHHADLIAGAARANASMSRFKPAIRLYADSVERMQAESTVARPVLIKVRQELAGVLEKDGQSDKAQAVREETASLMASQ